MDPVKRAADFLLQRVGHMVHPGDARFDSLTRHWWVAICCRTESGTVGLGEIELDADGHVLSAPSREELLEHRLGASATSA
jgi:hypothetical protein